MEHLLENRKNYDNDLELAAELGKILLERNKELEAQVIQLQQILEERDQGTGLLQKQVEVLRHANDSRMRIYEEVDKNAQELEKANVALRKANKVEKEKVKSLNETVEALESKCDEFQAKLEQIKRDNNKQNKKPDIEYKRTWSVPSLVGDNVDYNGLSPGSYDYLGFPSLNESWKKKKKEANIKELKDLKDSVKLIKLQYFAEQKRRIDLESDLSLVQDENVNLIAKVRELQDDILKREELKREIASAAAISSNSHHHSIISDKCAKCSSRAASITGSDMGDNEFIEHDLDDVPHKEVVRLKCGGSAYGSRESLNQIGLEAVTPTLESCSDILAVAVHQNSVNDSEGMSLTKPDPDSTLLGELEEQYRKLVKKYEHLVEIKKSRKEQEMKDAEAQINASHKSSEEEVVRRRPKSLTISKEVQTAWRKSSCLDFTSPVDPTDGHFQKGPPEYKKLFKEIFETLKRSADIDSDSSP